MFSLAKKSPLLVKRSENVPEIEMIVIPDKEKCKKPMNYSELIHEWRISDERRLVLVNLNTSTFLTLFFFCHRTISRN